MLSKRWLVVMVLAGAAITLSALVPVIFSGCNGDPCCPTIGDFKAQDLWVCPNCQKEDTKLFFTFGFLKKGKPCSPENPVGLYQIKNLTDGTVYVPPGQVDHSGDVYTNQSGGLPIDVTADCQIQLKVSGDKGCDPATRVIEIKVVDAGDFHELCPSYNGKPFGNGGFWEITTSIFGNGVAVDRVENINAFEVNVTHEGRTDGPIPGGQSSTLFRDIKASGTWIIEVPGQGTFTELTRKQANVCIRVYLKCLCP